jgi:hypothetical protein
MIVQNTIFITALFQIDSFDSWTCPLGEAEEKFCSTTQQGTVMSKFRVILRIGFDIITAMIVQNTIFSTNFFELKVLVAQHFRLEYSCQKKKNLLNLIAGNRAEKMHCYLSN